MHVAQQMAKTPRTIGPSRRTSVSNAASSRGRESLWLLAVGYPGLFCRCRQPAEVPKKNGPLERRKDRVVPRACQARLHHAGGNASRLLVYRANPVPEVGVRSGDKREYAMSGTRPTTKRDAGGIEREPRSELRSIIRQFIDLGTPLAEFELDAERPEGVPRHYVSFDRSRHRKITGLRFGSPVIRLPDERIEDAVLSLGKNVWHLKDRLQQWIRETGAGDDVNAWARGCQAVLICADLANRKKHGRNENMSGLDPRLTLVALDTSKNGVLELFYDGATKQKELLVSNTVPIPFRAEMATRDGTVFPDAVALIHEGFTHWLDLIQRLGFLEGSDRECEVLRTTLYPANPAT
jgi:hypothetical protein